MVMRDGGQRVEIQGLMLLLKSDGRRRPVVTALHAGGLGGGVGHRGRGDRD